MKITVAPGRYVVAVSGGVDSMALLHRLHALPGVQLTVAHFNHGIRPDSAEDQRLVHDVARQYGLPYVSQRAELGAGASEAIARQARYEFLHQVLRASGAGAIITAHHQDDALETAILNIVRGTGRRGLTSLQSTDVVKRPLLHLPKADIVRYARDNQLLWREDSTNSDDRYRRNYVRHKLLGRFGAADKQKLHDIVVNLRATNVEIDSLLAEVLRACLDQDRLVRGRFILLPHAIAREIMAAWLRQMGVAEIDTNMLERLVHGAKTLLSGKRLDVTGGRQLRITRAHLALTPTER